MWSIPLLSTGRSDAISHPLLQNSGTSVASLRNPLAHPTSIRRRMAKLTIALSVALFVKLAIGGPPKPRGSDFQDARPGADRFKATGAGSWADGSSGGSAAELSDGRNLKKDYGTSKLRGWGAGDHSDTWQGEESWRADGTGYYKSSGTRWGLDLICFLALRLRHRFV